MDRKTLWIKPACLLTLVAVFVGLAMRPFQSHADSEPVITVGQFSKAAEEAALPSGWAPLTFAKIARHTEYKVVKDDGTSVVQASSHSAASGIVSKVRIDLREYPLLTWRWKVPNVISKGAAGTKAGDDYAARIYITFQYDPDRVGFLKKAKYKLGRLLFGDIPIAAINYIWDNKTPIGTVVDSAYTDLSKMIVVESGETKAGRWVDEERNVYEDYKKAFGEEPPLVNGVAIMTDTDNTGEAAVSYYGDIVFKK